MKIWQVSEKIGSQFLDNHSDFDPLLLQLMFNRGLKETTDMQVIMNGGSFYDPFLFKNMEKIVQVIIKHLQAGNKIMVYGDYDADGVTSSVILQETLRLLHGVVEVYLPDRTTEGYGLNKTAISKFVKDGFKLIITVDNGIRNKQEVEYAQSLGLEVIITDHHVLPEKKEDLPPCLYLDPADLGDNYPWRYLAGVGVAFKLISALLLKSKLSAEQRKLISDKCLDLVAIGTVADMVNILGENRQLVIEGLKILNHNQRLGLQKLIEIAKIRKDKALESWNIGWQIAPRLNAASRMANANSAFSLLTTTDLVQAQNLAEELNNQNILRQKITAEIMAQVEEQIDVDNLPTIIIAVAKENQNWNEGVIGLVAGRIMQKYYRPTLIVVHSQKEDQGVATFKSSGRSISEFNLIVAIEACSQYLDKYGGHPMACGFSLLGEKNLQSFKKALEKLASQQLKAEDLIPKLKIDAVLDFSKINLKLITEINRLAPYGKDNPQPCFVSYGLVLEDIITMGINDQHIKFRLSSLNFQGRRTPSFWAIAFGSAQKYQNFKIGDKIDLVYYLEINEFQGRREVQLKIVDIKSSTD